MIQITQGEQVEGLTILEKVEDALRLCTIYKDNDNNIVVGFGGTRNNLRDALANLNTDPEALSLMDRIERWISVYQPATIKLLGHSQGGAHALKIAKWMERRPFDIYVTTYGGLPTAWGPHCSVVNYLRRDDPMAWVPWCIFGLRYFGIVKKVGKGVLWPSAEGHDPKSYLECEND